MIKKIILIIVLTAITVPAIIQLHKMVNQHAIEVFSDDLKIKTPYQSMVS